MKDFNELPIREELLQTLRENGITVPTPVQAKAIPLLLEGKDVVAQAQTGTGKTLAFVLPILQAIQPEQSHIQALIVAPTRELAVQITSEINKMIAHTPDVHVLAVYGGQDVERQLKKLAGAMHIVVGTPGRLLDHMRRETIDLSRLSTLVLDEADQMLHIGFLPEVEKIIENTSPDRQTALFSATMPGEIRALAKRYMKKPENVQIKASQITVEDIRQLAIETTDRTKQTSLRAMLDEQNPFLAMIFCRTKRRASTLNEALQSFGYNADELHGDLSQAKREKVMERFRQAKIQYLIATDVAARGLDVEGVTHVFNYDIPQDVESYIHRIGRTGRAGESGLAVTFYAPKDKQYLEMIERGIKMPIERREREQTEEERTERRFDDSRTDNRGQGKRKESRDGNRRNDERGRRPSQGRMEEPRRSSRERAGSRENDRRPSQGRMEEPRRSSREREGSRENDRRPSQGRMEEPRRSSRERAGSRENDRRPSQGRMEEPRRSSRERAGSRENDRRPSQGRMEEPRRSSRERAGSRENDRRPSQGRMEEPRRPSRERAGSRENDRRPSQGRMEEPRRSSRERAGSRKNDRRPSQGKGRTGRLR